MTSKGIFGIAVATLAVSTLLAGCAGYHGSNAASAAIYSGEEQSVDIRHEVEQA